MTRLTCLLALSGAALLAQSTRPMSFRDVIEVRSVGSPDVSADGRWMVYSLTSSDWKAGQRYSDLYLVSMSEGAPSTRRLTFTADRNESSPRWSPDGRLIAFLSDRDAPTAGAVGEGGRRNQLYVIRPDGGEARKVSDGREGVASFAFSKDGQWLAFSAGKEDERQIWIGATAAIDTGKPEQLTNHATGVLTWQFAPDSRRIYFTARDEAERDNRTRVEKKFTARLRNEPRSLAHLWAIVVETKTETRLTKGSGFSVADLTVSKDGAWIGFRGESPERYQRGVTEAFTYSDLYLLEAATGQVERLTNNAEIGESGLQFSPDSKRVAFTAADEFQFFRNGRVWIREVGERGGRFRKAGDYDGDISTGFFSKDGKTIYFNAGVRATRQVMALDVASGKVTQITKVEGSVSASQDENSEALLLTYSDPASPADLYTAATPADMGDRGRWRRLTDSNAEVRSLALGQTSTVQWKSRDGRLIEGVLTRPASSGEGTRYPLIVSIHGGPAGADVLSFPASSTNYAHVLAGAGYLVLQPNYRGSIHYGERFKMETAGDYFRLGFDDIMTGVDHLIGQGWADRDRMGVMGWSAGGHYSNWILTHTDRFKAISSGAGAVNWISMYAQSDMQRVREQYFGGRPYDIFDGLWNMSPLKYIKQARTPTLIHCVDGDPRVPRPQSDELHMALRKLGVPTEYLVYPGNTHGITEPRNQMVKMVSEFQWFEKYVRGKATWFEWKDVLATLEGDNGNR